MGKLYQDDGRLTAAGGILYNKAYLSFQPWFTKAFVQGNPAEVAAMLHSTIEDLRCETILTNDKDREWRTIRCANQDCAATLAIALEDVHDEDMQIVFPYKSARAIYLRKHEWLPTEAHGDFCSKRCMPNDLRKRLA